MNDQHCRASFDIKSRVEMVCRLDDTIIQAVMTASFEKNKRRRGITGAGVEADLGGKLRCRRGGGRGGGGSWWWWW